MGERNAVHQNPEQPGVTLVPDIHEPAVGAVVVGGDPANEQRAATAVRASAAHTSPECPTNWRLRVQIKHKGLRAFSE